jgi:hypothetical protein
VQISGATTAPSTTRYAEVVLSKDTGPAVRFDSATFEMLPNVQEAWQVVIYDPPSINDYLNSWEPYTTGGFVGARYFMDTEGFILLGGAVKNGSGVNTNVFVLPAGHWPDAPMAFAVACSGGTGTVTIDTSGNVKIVTGSTTWTAFDGIRFRPA